MYNLKGVPQSVIFSLNHFLGRLMLEVGKGNVDVSFRELRGDNLEIVSLTFFKLDRSSSRII